MLSELFVEENLRLETQSSKLRDGLQLLTIGECICVLLSERSDCGAGELRTVRTVSRWRRHRQSDENRGKKKIDERPPHPFFFFLFKIDELEMTFEIEK